MCYAAYGLQFLILATPLHTYSIICVTSWPRNQHVNCTLKQSVFMHDKGKAIPVTGREGP
jgi:hypothetical protein